MNAGSERAWTRARVEEHVADAVEGLDPVLRMGFGRYAIEARTLWYDGAQGCDTLWALAFTRGGVLVFETGERSFGIARLRSSDWVDDYGSFGGDLAPALLAFLRIADS